MTTDYLPIEDFRRLFPYLTYDNYLAIRVSLETGLRIGDVVALRTADLQGDVLKYTASKTGKQGKAKITKDLADKLKRYAGTEYIFASSSKLGHRTRQAVWKNIKQAAHACGITVNVAPHSARKTFAVGVAKRQGFAAAQRALQHDSAAVTGLYVYSGLLTEAQSKATASLCADDLEALADMIADKVVERLLCVKGASGTLHCP